MVRRRAKVFLPRWFRLVMTPFFILIWAVMTWGIWFSGEPREADEVWAWWLGTIALLFAAVLIWAVSSGKLPAYEIEFDDDDPRG